jgi:hypothetical protein
VLITTLVAAEARAGETLTATSKARACKADGLGQTTCDFQIGRDLSFSIVAIGTQGQGLTVFRANWDGDYYLSFGLDHQCIIVKPGATRRPKAFGFDDLAFISLKSGKVYADWPSCKANL